MNSENVVKSTQEQAVAAWISRINDLRVIGMIEKIADQNCNFERAMKELQDFKKFISDPSHILGSYLQKHGEIAEHAQVNFSNAERIIVGLEPNHSFEGVGRTAMEDYIRSGQMVQAKSYFGEAGTLFAINDHFNTYPNFLKEGGVYDIPKSQYARLIDVYNRGTTDCSALSKSDRTLFDALRHWESETETQFSDSIHPMVVDYEDVQLDNAGATLAVEEKKIENDDKRIRDNISAESKPNLHEGMRATAAAAAIEGGLAFSLGMYKKLKEGKSLTEFSAADWKEIGVDTSKGAVKGGIRGSAVYMLTNFAKTPAPVASAMVTASIGMAAESIRLANNEITPRQFIDRSEVICMDVTISAMASTMGTILIPIPVLGTVIGNATGMFMWEIAKQYLSEEETKLIEEYQREIETSVRTIDEEYYEITIAMEKNLAAFNSITDLAFNQDINIAFNASIEMARFSGVDEDEMILFKKDGDKYFMS